MSEYILYKKDKDIPKYREMECYFSAPLIGMFSEINNYYYLIVYSSSEDTWWVMMHDESYMSCMNGGCIIDNDTSSKYQADEYQFESVQEVNDFLEKCGYDYGSVNDINIIMKKLKKHVLKKDKKKDKIKIDKYILDENIYLIHECDEFWSQSEIDNMPPYMKKGTEVKLIDDCYESSDGSSVPMEYCRVHKI